MSGAQSYRLRHLVEIKCLPSSHGPTLNASQRAEPLVRLVYLHWTCLTAWPLTSATASLFDRSKTPPARKASNISHQRPQPSHSGAGPETCVKGAVLPRRSSVRAAISAASEILSCRCGTFMSPTHSPTWTMHNAKSPPVVELFQRGTLRAPLIEPVETSLRRLDHAVP